MLDDIDIDSDDSGDGGSWFSRASGGSRRLSSAALFLGALALLFWNENHSKRHADALSEVAAQVQEVDATALNPLLDGKPVHLSARVVSKAGARDDVFGVRTDGVALYRHVQMFQWIEYEESTGRGANKRTTYTYEQDWDYEYHDSSQFHEPAGHENPKPVLVSDGFFAADARFGPYRFDNDEVAEQALADSYSPEEPGSLGNWPAFVEQLPELSSELTAKRWYQIDEATYYRGNQASDEAAIGDLQVSFYTLSNDYPLTMVAAQQGDHLEPWRASNGDHILLAAGGKLPADDVVKIAEVQGAGLTHILRLVGLAGAVIGAAGVGAWLGGFLSMVPVVGRLVGVSLSIAGGLFGLMAGLLTIVIGWLSARPWIAAVLLIAIGSAVTWAIRKGRGAEQQARRAKRASDLAAAARQRAAEALAKATPPAPAMALAAAGPAGAMPPPPPPTAPKPGAARFSASEPATAPVPMPAPPPAPKSAPAAAADPSGDLPPLEWEPGLIKTKPPSVRPAAPAPPPAAASAAPPPPAAPPRPAAVAAPAVAASTAGAITKRFDALPVPPSGQPLFDTVPMREAPVPFEPMLPPAGDAPLFDTVPMRESAAPLFESVPMRESAPARFDDVTPELRAPAPAPAPPAPAAAKTVRIALGSKGDYGLNKIVRVQADGQQQVLCFELTHAGKPVKRGTQDEVKEALRRALSGGVV